MTESPVGDSIIHALRQWLLDLPRHKKRALLMVLDFLMLSAVLWALMIFLRLGTSFWPDSAALVFLLVSGPVLTIISFSYAGLYRMVTRYLGSRGNTRIVGAVAIAVLVWALVVFMSGQQGVPRSLYHLRFCIHCSGDAVAATAGVDAQVIRDRTAAI